MKRLLSTAVAISLVTTSFAQACGTQIQHAVGTTDHSAHHEHASALFDASYDLIDHTGVPAKPERFVGKYQLVFFGFTNCPDVCPIGLDVIYRALDLLPEETSAKAQPILITIDPDRDTPQVLADYVQAFDDGLIGMTGPQDAIDAATRAFGVLAIKDHTSHDGHYNMNHTSSIYVIGPDGKACATTPSNISAADLKDQFAEILR